MTGKLSTGTCRERDRLAQTYNHAQRRCATLTLARGRLGAITGLVTEQIEDLIEAAREAKDAAFQSLTEHIEIHACASENATSTPPATHQPPDWEARRLPRRRVTITDIKRY